MSAHCLPAKRSDAPEDGMPMSAPHEPPPGSKPAQILDAAKTLFMEQGYGATSMDAIARTANVSKATLYAHFSGKEELFAAMVGDECRRQSRRLHAPDVGETDLVEALREIGRNFLELVLSPQAVAIHRVVVGEVARFPELGRIFHRSGPAVVREQLAAYLRGAAERGLLALDDPYRAAEQFIGMVQVPLQMRVMLGLDETPAEADIARVVDTAVAVLIKAYAPPAGDSPA
jgi:TetR/AcrR family transcriptional regulator, mexJK operon transcriptional repressor